MPRRAPCTDWGGVQSLKWLKSLPYYTSTYSSLRYSPADPLVFVGMTLNTHTIRQCTCTHLPGLESTPLAIEGHPAPTGAPWDGSGPLGPPSPPYATLYSRLLENGKFRMHTRSRRKRRSLVCIQQCTLHRFTSVGVVNIKADGCVSPKTGLVVHPGYL